ncbi:hypothetical protein LCGC14_2752330, partial [marine sediment metagenome]
KAGSLTTTGNLFLGAGNITTSGQINLTGASTNIITATNVNGDLRLGAGGGTNDFKIDKNGNVDVFENLTIGGTATGIAPTVDLHLATKKYVDDNDYWDRTGTVLKPETAGDEVHIEAATNNKLSKWKKIAANNLMNLKDNVVSLGGEASGLNFNAGGGAEYVSIGATNVFDGLGALSISVWVKLTTASGFDNILTQHNGFPNSVFFFGLKDGKITAGLNTSGSFEESVTAVSTGVWTHVGWTFDGTNYKYYINGSHLTGEDDLSSPDTTTGTVDVSLLIGKQQNSSTNDFDGVMDELAIWSRTLTDDDMADLYAAGAGFYINKADNFPTSGTSQGLNQLGNWKFNEATGTLAADSSDSGLDGTLTDMEEADWVAGKISIPGSNKEIKVIQSRDGKSAGEFGAEEFGDDDVRATINGKTIRF